MADRMSLETLVVRATKQDYTDPVVTLQTETDGGKETVRTVNTLLDSHFLN